MEKRLQRRSIVTVLLVVIFAFITGLAVLFASLNETKKASGQTDTQNPAATVYLGIGGIDNPNKNVFYYESFQLGWKKVVDLAATASAGHSTAYVKAVLMKDWRADSAVGFGDDEGATKIYFSEGRILVPANTNIVIDLKGNSIDRNLTSGIVNGQVMQITGNLTVEDSSASGNGKITGGYNYSAAEAYGGGIYVSGGTFTLNGGSIEGNRATGASVYGIGVVIRGGTFNMYGGSISGHNNTTIANSFGGGVCVYNSGTFNMYGGVIENNSAVLGGGVACYNVSGLAINLDGGTIRGNKAVSGESDAMQSGGGGICVYAQGDLNIQSGEIGNNISDNFGGGVYVVGYAGTSNLYIHGGRIHHNVVASLSSKVYGGGVAIQRHSDTKYMTDVYVNAEMTGGVIENNTIVSNCENERLSDGKTYSYEAMGGGVYILRAAFAMTSGEIVGNRAASFKTDATAADLEAVYGGNFEKLCDGSRTFGGGMAVIYNGNSASDKDTLAAGSLNISGGFVRGNRAKTGGGLNVNGILTLSGGSITGNYALSGGGLELTSSAKVSLSGGPIVEGNYSAVELGNEKIPSNLQMTAVDAVLQITGEFTDNARIHMSVGEALLERGRAITQGYGTYNRKFVSVDGSTTNGVWVYANPYRYFVSDDVYSLDGTSVDPSTVSKQHLIVLQSGELGVFEDALKFVVEYSDESEKEFIFGSENAENAPEWNYVEATYGNATYPVSVSAPDAISEPSISVRNKAGVYTLAARAGISSTRAEFSVIVKSRTLTTEDVTITLTGVDGLKYDGAPKMPTACKVALKDGTELTSGTDYTISYRNNVNAGEAIVIITFKGNYAGEARTTYTIGTSDNTNINMQVTWEVEIDDVWQDFVPAGYANTFMFDGTDQGAKIRAVLTVEQSDRTIVQTVYVKNVRVADTMQNASMWLDFKKGGESTEFKNAGTYSITVVGNGNYRILDADRTIEGVVMKKMLLRISASDFNNDANNAVEKQWLLKIGLGDNPIYTNLLSRATYIDPDAKENQYGEKVRTGELEDSYARYRGTAMALVLNGNYVLKNGMTVAELLAMTSSVEYTPADGTVGESGKVEVVTTTVTITFGDNYSVYGGNTITLDKEWFIVTITNHLRMSDGSDISAALTGWTFGYSNEVKDHAFRPEHGNTLIYTYYKSDSKDVLHQFALVYSDDTKHAVKEFYEVKTVDGKVVADTTKPLGDSNYLYSYHYSLKAGTYKVRVTVPQNAPDTGTHVHWWDGEAADDYGTVYYEFTYEFSFVVGIASISDGGAPSSDIRYDYIGNRYVEYTGKADNVVELEIWLDNKLLVEGEDYELSSASINVGAAVLTVRGINSLEGQFTILNAFTIVQARNGWSRVPSIMQWSYYGFNKNINLLSGKAYFPEDSSELWFAISRDSKGKELISGLEHFTVDEKGRVTDEIASILKGLPAADYYLIGSVDGTDNYSGLNPEPIPFTVAVANNSWEVTPSVNTWTVGEYGAEVERVLASAVFGTVHVLIVDSKGNVYYDSDNKIDILSEAKAGSYTLTAYVDAADDYYGLDVYTVLFEVFKKPGLPWWATVAIAVGALGVAALVIFILWKKGVFQILTERLVVSIRTRASVEATIASVRAAKMLEEGRQSVAEAKRRERLEKLRKKVEDHFEMTPEERAAQMEARAHADAVRAEKLRARSEETFARAAKVRSDDDSPEE